MIVRDIMTTKLITVEPSDTLSHAANLLRHHQFHHLPVAKTQRLPATASTLHAAQRTIHILEGLLTSQDIDLVAAIAKLGTADSVTDRPWQERPVSEVMHRAALRVTPTTSVAAAAKLLVERNLNYLPVVEYEQIEQQTKTLLVGLVTRSDLLLTLARSLGAFEPGMQLDIALPMGNMEILARVLHIASELHMAVRSVIAAPLVDGMPSAATLRLGTINPTPMLIRLKEEGIDYTFADQLVEGV